MQHITSFFRASINEVGKGMMTQRRQRGATRVRPSGDSPAIPNDAAHNPKPGASLTTKQEGFKGRFENSRPKLPPLRGRLTK